MSTTFSRGNLLIRPTEHQDILPVAFNMRPADCEEIWASNLVTPLEALQRGVKHSRPCMTAILKGEPIALFGIVPVSPILATIWFLGTPRTEDIPVCFGRTSRSVVRKFLSMYPTLFNFVDVRNKKSIEWLKWLGAKFSDPEPYGELGLQFRKFIIQRGALKSV